MIVARWHPADTPAPGTHSRAVCGPTRGGSIRMYLTAAGGAR
jgi:hypothetical protein